MSIVGAGVTGTARVRRWRCSAREGRVRLLRGWRSRHALGDVVQHDGRRDDGRHHEQPRALAQLREDLEGSLRRHPPHQRDHEEPEGAEYIYLSDLSVSSVCPICLHQIGGALRQWIA